MPGAAPNPPSHPSTVTDRKCTQGPSRREGPCGGSKSTLTSIDCQGQEPHPGTLKARRPRDGLGERRGTYGQGSRQSRTAVAPAQSAGGTGRSSLRATRTAGHYVRTRRSWQAKDHVDGQPVAPGTASTAVPHYPVHDAQPPCWPTEYEPVTAGRPWPKQLSFTGTLQSVRAPGVAPADYCARAHGFPAKVPSRHH